MRSPHHGHTVAPALTRAAFSEVRGLDREVTLAVAATAAVGASVTLVAGLLVALGVLS